jgi:hypothetical protein
MLVCFYALKFKYVSTNILKNDMKQQVEIGGGAAYLVIKLVSLPALVLKKNLGKFLT